MEADLNLISQEKDRYLNEIKNLSWLPWVGRNYFQSKRRVLIIAESHYNIGDNIEYKNQKTQGAKWVTRDVVQYYPVLNCENNPMFENLHRCLFQTNKIDRNSIWSHIAFYNFVQRPMDYNIKERPTTEDWQIGWSVFFEVINILKPTDCIFVGVGAADHFNDYVSIRSNIKYNCVNWINVENSKRYARKFSFEIHDYKLSCLAIQHTSHHFSWHAWNQFLQHHFKDALHYLNKLAKVENKEVVTEITDETWVQKVPCYLNHKPIVVCDGNVIEPNSDLRYISVGRSQWDNNDSASVKTFRWANKRWSRMSEEVPIERLPEMMLMFLSTIKNIQSKRKDEETPIEPTYMHETFIKEDDWEFLEEQLTKHEIRISKSLKALKEIINEIDIDDI